MSSDSPSGILLSLLEHRAAMRSFISKKLGCSDAAEDILQSVAEKILSKQANTAIVNPRAYLYRMAENELVSHYRSQNTRLKYESLSAIEPEPGLSSPIEASTEASQLLHGLSSSLDELPALTRQIFILYRIEGLKQRQIAEQLGINLSTVEKRLALALKFLRQRMQTMKNNER